MYLMSGKLARGIEKFYIGVPRLAGSGYILGAATFASLATRLLKRHQRPPQGVTIPNADAFFILIILILQYRSIFLQKSKFFQS